jgi:hypothetical protein
MYVHGGEWERVVIASTQLGTRALGWLVASSGCVSCTLCSERKKKAANDTLGEEQSCMCALPVDSLCLPPNSDPGRHLLTRRFSPPVLCGATFGFDAVSPCARRRAAIPSRGPRVSSAARVEGRASRRSAWSWPRLVDTLDPGVGRTPRGVLEGESDEALRALHNASWAASGEGRAEVCGVSRAPPPCIWPVCRVVQWRRHVATILQTGANTAKPRRKHSGGARRLTRTRPRRTVSAAGAAGAAAGRRATVKRPRPALW